MAGTLVGGDDAYDHFNAGYAAKNPPLSSVDKRMLDFAAKVKNQPVTKTHGQILRNFGMYPPEFWLRAQRLSGHPDIDPAIKSKIDAIFPDPSRPGPMGGGAPIKTDGKSFSHGLEW